MRKKKTKYQIMMANIKKGVKNVLDHPKRFSPAKPVKIGKNLCIQCHKKPILVKKRQLCSSCYQKFRNANRDGFILNAEHPYSYLIAKKKENAGEIEFIKNYFDHKNWIPQPASFSLNGKGYRPDFYDGERNTFIEVSSTRQVYSANKEKYILFQKLYPKLNFEIRKPSGELLDEDKPIHPQLL